MPRLLSVVRLQLVNRQTYLWMPLIILGGAVALSILVFQLIPGTGIKYAGGAAAAPLWYFGIVGGQSLSLTFPFALALSVTRREFHLGTLLTATLASMMLAGIYCAIALIEMVTDGWGVNGYVTTPGLGADELGVSFLTYFAVSMTFFAIGYAFAAILKRWGGLVLTVVITLLILLLTGALILLVRQGAWPAVAAWFGGLGYGGGSLLALAVVAMMWIGSYMLVRRLTP